MTDERWAESEPRLVELLRDEILAAPGRHITFARFMERALTEPGLGYYATSQARPMREGDFLTAPELHPFFGRMVGRKLDEMWRRLGSPPRFVVREYGAGRGTLAAAITAGLAADGSGLARALEHQAIDLAVAPSSDPVVGCILANEFLDALPVHRVEGRDGDLREIFVTWRDDWLADESGEPSTVDLLARLKSDGVELAEGARAEICLAAPVWLARAADALEHGGLLIIDYGHAAADLYGPRHAAGTLLGYRGHRVEADPFRAVGRMDLTAHVDITALDQAANRAGLEPIESTTLGPFVAALGLGDVLSDLGRDPTTDPSDYLLARAAVARMLDPRHLGSFRVLLYGRGMTASKSPPTSRPQRER